MRVTIRLLLLSEKKFFVLKIILQKKMKVLRVFVIDRVKYGVRLFLIFLVFDIFNFCSHETLNFLTNFLILIREKIF